MVLLEVIAPVHAFHRMLREILQLGQRAERNLRDFPVRDEALAGGRVARPHVGNGREQPLHGGPLVEGHGVGVAEKRRLGIGSLGG